MSTQTIGVRGEARRRAPAIINKAMEDGTMFTSSGSLRGEPVTAKGGIDTGRMPDREADRLKSFDRLGMVDYVIWSYTTPIAYRIRYGHPQFRDKIVSRVIIPAVTYSNSTGKQQSVIRCAIAEYDV
jgi:hypothetical protein